MAESPPPRPRTGVGARLRAFAATYGWRAYAVPVLVVATLLTVLDLADGAAPESSAQDRPVTSVTSVTVGGGSESAAATPAPGAPTPAGGAGPTSTPAPPPEPPTVVQRGEGTLSVVPGSSGVLGTGGATLRFRVEVEDGIDVDGAPFAAAVEATLGDPRSWGADGRTRFRRVSDGDYDFRVLLVSPDNVNDFCPGLDTGGFTSCRSGERAVINLARWLTGIPDYRGDLPTYRQYVINHEVGHYLGHGHEPCPGPGQLAPVMQQQTLSLDGCRRNAWPYP